MRQRIIALLQARSDSKRLPGKVLKPILGTPMIIHQIQRTFKSSLIDKLILVTSDESSDDRLAQIVKEYDFDLFRGNKDNVLKRFFDALKPFDLSDNDIIVRLTGDCPLHDSDIIDESISSFLQIECDYLTNALDPAIYPDGMDVEVFNYYSLKKAYKNAKKVSDLEHVTPYIRDSNCFKVCNLDKMPIHPEFRLTVDEEDDFLLVSKIYEHFGSNDFSFNEIIDYLEKNNELLKINSKFGRNEGYIESI